MLILQSPAKINLFLRVINRRPDGYHNLASLFQTISLVDTLSFALEKQDSLTCSDPSLPTDASNLVLKAATLFRRKTGLNFGLRAHLEKRIPHQAGLGGGSGNAATTLWALNQLCGQPASEAELRNWSAEIGSDIPFFFSSGTAFCTGRGEFVRQLDPLSLKQLWIIKPPLGLSTPAVFQKLELAKLCLRDSEQILNRNLSGQSIFFNDLESAAFSAMPPLAELKHLLEDAGFSSVVMTGTGSSFFCFGEPKKALPSGLYYKKVSYISRASNSWYTG